MPLPLLLHVVILERWFLYRRLMRLLYYMHTGVDTVLSSGVEDHQEKPPLLITAHERKLSEMRRGF